MEQKKNILGDTFTCAILHNFLYNVHPVFTITASRKR